MSSTVEPLSTFTLVRPNAAQKEAYLKAQFVPWNRGLSWEVSELGLVDRLEQTVFVEWLMVYIAIPGNR